MSNVIHLHPTRRGPGNDPNAIFLAKVLAKGLPPAMRKLRSMLWLGQPKERDGRYAVVDGALLHLAGWSTCRITADTMNLSLDNAVTDDGETMQLRQWPYDVSSWPALSLSDAPGAWHLPQDQWEAARADP